MNKNSTEVVGASVDFDTAQAGVLKTVAAEMSITELEERAEMVAVGGSPVDPTCVFNFCSIF